MLHRGAVDSALGCRHRDASSRLVVLIAGAAETARRADAGSACRRRASAGPVVRSRRQRSKTR